MWARRTVRPTMWALIILAGCQSATLNERAGVGCVELANQITLSDRILTLNLLSDAFSQGCYGTVIDYGAKAHSAQDLFGAEGNRQHVHSRWHID